MSEQREPFLFNGRVCDGNRIYSDFNIVKKSITAEVVNDELLRCVMILNSSTVVMFFLGVLVVFDISTFSEICRRVMVIQLYRGFVQISGDSFFVQVEPCKLIGFRVDFETRRLVSYRAFQNVAFGKIKNGMLLKNGILFQNLSTYCKKSRRDYTDIFLLEVETGQILRKSRKFGDFDSWCKSKVDDTLVYISASWNRETREGEVNLLYTSFSETGSWSQFNTSRRYQSMEAIVKSTGEEVLICCSNVIRGYDRETERHYQEEAKFRVVNPRKGTEQEVSIPPKPNFEEHEFQTLFFQSFNFCGGEGRYHRGLRFGYFRLCYFDMQKMKNLCLGEIDALPGHAKFIEVLEVCESSFKILVAGNEVLHSSPFGYKSPKPKHFCHVVEIKFQTSDVDEDSKVRMKYATESCYDQFNIAVQGKEENVVIGRIFMLL